MSTIFMSWAAFEGSISLCYLTLHDRLTLSWVYCSFKFEENHFQSLENNPVQGFKHVRWLEYIVYISRDFSNSVLSPSYEFNDLTWPDFLTSLVSFFVEPLENTWSNLCTIHSYYSFTFNLFSLRVMRVEVIFQLFRVSFTDLNGT